MNSLTVITSCVFMLTITYSIHSYPLIAASHPDSLSPSQIDHLCSYILQLEEHPIGTKTTKSESPRGKRFMPFPDMNRFLSNSQKIHRNQPNIKSGTELSSKKHDFQAYLCSILNDSEEISNFINMFMEEHGHPPALTLFESCESITKRDQVESNNNEDNDISTAVRLNELTDYCLNRPESRFAKRWKQTVEGPISIDFINQMLESRKVKSYPYSAGVDPYLVGR